MPINRAKVTYFCEIMKLLDKKIATKKNTFPSPMSHKRNLYHTYYIHSIPVIAKNISFY